MAKAYIHSSVAICDGENWREEIRFTSLPDNSEQWGSLDTAEIDRADWNRGVKVQSTEGRIHLIRDFKIEQIPSGDFLISCDLPFIGQ